MTPARDESTAKKGLPKTLPGVVALVGDEERKKERLLQELIDRAGSDAGVVSWQKDGAEKAESEVSRLLSDYASRPLFGGTKVLVARDGDALVKRAGKALSAAIEVDSGNRLVLMMRALDQRTSFAKKLKKAGGLFVCARPRAETDASGAVPPGSELVREILAEAARRGLQLEPRAAAELAGRTGNDLLLASNELEKIATHLGDGGDKKVTSAVIDALVPQSAAWDQFQLFQEVATGNLPWALRRVRGMIEMGTVDRGGRRTTDPRSIALALVALLHQRIRLLARFRALQARGVRGEEMQQALRIRNPGQLYYLGKEANLPIVAAAESAVAALAEADRGLKLGQPPKVLLERLVVRLARAATPTPSSRGAAPGRRVERRW